MSTAKNEVRLLALNEEGKENVEAVCKLLKEQKVKNTWVEAHDVISTNQNEEDVIYVVDPTEGKEVDYLVQLGYSVIGPQCALTVLKHNILLKNNLKYPVYNLTMLGCLICFSNIEPQKRVELRIKVEQMGGKVTGSLTQDVTHLVVKEVGSVKYFSAAHVGIPVMVLDWIDHLWRHGQSRYISAKDGKWEEFKCPVFLGCSVCVTGFNTAERNRIQKLITKFGGTYSGAMKLDFTTHLVVHKPEGQKYMMASQFGVKVVNVNWVYKSVEKGSCQDHSKYPVRACEVLSKPDSSTPERSEENGRVPAIHDMSNISVMTVNETVTSSMADVSTLSTIGLPPCLKKNEKNEILNFPVSRSTEQILDGISMFLIGFSMKEEEKFQLLLSSAGATRCNQLTSVLTHVLVGPSTSLPESLKVSINATYNKSESDLSVVSYKWMLDSLMRNELLSESDYWMNDVVRRRQDSNQDQTTFVESESRLPEAESNERVSVDTSRDPDVTLMQEVVSQYMGGEETGDTTMLRDFDLEKAEQEREMTVNDHEDKTDHNESSRWTFFRGLTFNLIGFDEEEMNRCVDNIESLSGRILPSYSKKVADYAVVPITGCRVEKTVSHIVTDFWVDLCLTEGCLVGVDTHPLSTPFAIPNNASPLEGCVTCLSKYLEPERSHLVDLMKGLGAMYQDNVARKDMPPLRRTTHLVVMVPEGDKYVGCKKWGIPTVTAEWIYDCARHGRKAPESEYTAGKEELENTDQSKINPPIQPPPELPNPTNDVTLSKSDLTSVEEVENRAPLQFPPMPRPPSAVDHIRRRLEAKNAMELEQNKQTPFKDRVLRLMDTPSKLLRPDSNQDISFELDEVFDFLRTPSHVRKRIKNSITSNPDTPLSACVERFLLDAIKDIPDADDSLVKNLEKIFDEPMEEKTKWEEEPEEEKSIVHEEENNKVEPEDNRILRGVVLYVCKKLTKQRVECSDVVVEMGGEFRWTYDKACTHFVFQGKPNDMNREFRAARSEGKLIVSPYWLTACKEARARLDEGGFPHVYNPSKSIKILPSSSQAKSKRATRSSVQQPPKNARQTRSKSRTSSSENDDVTTQKLEEDNETVKASQEARESLKKTLETIMSSTGKLNKNTTARRSCSRSNVYSSPPHLLALPPRRVGQPTGGQPTNDKPESSQDVHVTWDDPIGRETMEKIMREESGESSLSTENKEDECLDEIQACKDAEEQLQLHTETKQDATPLKDPPAVNDVCLSQIVREGGIPAFLISSVTPEQKIEYAAIIEQLGGIYLDRDYFDVKCTHLVVKKPARNEKFLASLASGKWILHTSYVEACREAGAFVKEDRHEYGNPLTSWSPANDTELLLSAAAHRWRRFLNKNRSPEGDVKGAFSDWKVLLHVSPRHTPGFVRLLQSGSGRVVARSLPYDGDVSELSYAIMDPNRLKDVSRDFLASLCGAGVHCCVPEYIADFLMKDPQPSVEECYLPVVKELLAGGEGEKPMKRRKVT